MEFGLPGLDSIMGFFAPQGYQLEMAQAMSQNPESLIPFLAQSGIRPDSFNARFAQDALAPNPLVVKPVRTEAIAPGWDATPDAPIGAAERGEGKRIPMSGAAASMPLRITSPAQETSEAGQAAQAEASTAEKPNPLRSGAPTDLVKALAGIKAPAAPEVPRLYSHAPPAPRPVAAQGAINALLAAYLPRLQAQARLGQVIGR